LVRIKRISGSKMSTTFKLRIENIESNIREVVPGNRRSIEADVMSSVKGDLSICYGGSNVVRSSVEVLRVYFDLKDALFQVIIRGMPSFIRVRYEEVLALFPDNEGCVLSQPPPPYPVDSRDLARETLDLVDIKSIMRGFEINIREAIKDDREKLMILFELSQSPVLFDILRVIDARADIRSNN